MRTVGEQGQLGNWVAQMLARLPIGEPDPSTRYRKVVELTASLKRSH